jgi:hypothetical protein
MIKVNLNWLHIDWIGWLQDESLHVHISMAMDDVKWGWMTRHERIFYPLGPGVCVFSTCSLLIPDPFLTIQSLHNLEWPWPRPPPRISQYIFSLFTPPRAVFPTPLPAIYCVFLVTIHESFQLVNYHIFSNFGTPYRASYQMETVGLQPRWRCSVGG